MANIRAKDGAYLLNGKQFKYTKDELNHPVLNVIGQAGGAGGDGDFKADGSVPMEGNLYMSGNAIMGVKSISNTDSGMAIESEVSLNNHKITDLLNPVAGQDAATKKYVDERSVLGADGKIDSELDMNEHAVEPVDGKTNVFLLSGIGDQYGVNVEKEGYTGKHLTITNDKDQTLNVELVENPQG